MEAVGKDVTHVQPGDEVFGAKSGALAEYVTVRDAIVKKPASITFEEAAAVPVAAITALQGLRDKGQLQAGQRVLINGASGGVGRLQSRSRRLSEQRSRASAARGTSSSFARSEPITSSTTRARTSRGASERYDLMLDVAGSRSWSECTRVLKPHATVVIVGAPKGSRVLGPLGHIIRLRVASLLRGSQKAVFFIAKTTERTWRSFASCSTAGRSSRSSTGATRWRSRRMRSGTSVRVTPGQGRRHGVTGT